MIHTLKPWAISFVDRVVAIGLAVILANLILRCI